jgi:uncharacterized protein YndB with AHSA1/START domain
MSMLGIAFTLGMAITNDYHRIADERGVTVYKNDRLGGIALAAEGELPAPPDKVRRVLTDYASHPRWNKHLKECRVLSHGDDWLVVYERLGLPMIADRDYTLRVRWGERDGGEWLQFRADNSAGPAPQEGAVRVATHEGLWELTPVAGGTRTRARYFFHLDLGGSLPGWMAKGRAGKDVPRLFDQIRDQLKYY